MHEPVSFFQISKDPELLTGTGLDSPVVASRYGGPPPAGLNSLRPPEMNDLVLAWRWCVDFTMSLDSQLSRGSCCVTMWLRRRRAGWFQR